MHIAFLSHFYYFQGEEPEFLHHFAIDTVNSLSPEPVLFCHRGKQDCIEHFTRLIQKGSKELMRDLKNGKRRTVTLVQGNKQHHITIDANPRFKSLNLYNTKGQKIALDKNGNRLLGQKKGLQRKVRLRKGLVGKDRMRIKRN